MEIQKSLIDDLKKIKSLETQQLKIDEFNNCQQCQECDIKILEQENDKIRNFATYNIVNKEARALLYAMYNDKYKSIETEKFKKEIIKGFKKRNQKNMKLDYITMEKWANNKYDSIFNGLKFLNIIEPSESNEKIELTSDGEKFVEEYIKNKEEI